MGVDSEQSSAAAFFNEQGCLTDDTLSSITAGEELPDEVYVHLDQCDLCAMRMATSDDADSLLTELRSAVSGEDDAAAWAPEGYRIDREIHRGAQGAVFEAFHEPTKRTVAMKVLLGGRLSTTRQRLRFEREVELAAGLAHPGIVAVHDSGVGRDGQPYVVMELVEGDTIDNAVGELDAAGVAQLFKKVCDAVAHAHTRAVIHRDLKPSNILVDKQGQPRLVDFGIARQQQGAGASLTLTEGDAFLGTLGYAAPEQVEGRSAQADTRTDVYALGLVLYELLTAKPAQASEAGSLAEAIREITERSPVPPHRVDPAIERDLSSIVMKAIAKEPDRRYASAADLASDLERFIAGRPVEAYEAGAAYIAIKFASRHRRAVAVAATALALVIAAGGVIAVQAARVQRGNAANAVNEGMLMAFNLDESQGMNQAEALRRYGLEIDERLARFPEMQAERNMQLGMAMRSRDLYSEAEQRFSKALETRTGIQAEPELIAAAHEERGQTRWLLGSFEQSLSDFRTALRLRAESSGESSPEAARVRGQIGSTLTRLGDRTAAEAELMRAIEDLRAHAETNEQARSWMANAMNSLAVCLSYAQRYDECAQLTADALAIVRGLADPDPLAEPRLLTSRATYLMRLRRFEEAREALDEALRLKRAWRGPEADDADVARTQFRLADLERRMAQSESGEDFDLLLSARDNANAAVEIFRRVHFDRPHAQTGEALMLLGSIQIGLGQADAAVVSLTAALAQFERQPETSPSLGEARTGYYRAEALARLAKHEEALAQARASEQAFRAVNRDPRGEFPMLQTLIATLESELARSELDQLN